MLSMSDRARNRCAQSDGAPTTGALTTISVDEKGTISRTKSCSHDVPSTVRIARQGAKAHAVMTTTNCKKIKTTQKAMSTRHDLIYRTKKN